MFMELEKVLRSSILFPVISDTHVEYGIAVKSVCCRNELSEKGR